MREFTKEELAKIAQDGYQAICEDKMGKAGLRKVAAFALAQMEENAKLRACVEAADALSEYAYQLTGLGKWADDGNHLLVHSDGMLNLEGLSREYRAARAEVDK